MSHARNIKMFRFTRFFCVQWGNFFFFRALLYMFLCFFSFPFLPTTVSFFIYIFFQVNFSLLFIVIVVALAFSLHTSTKQTNNDLLWMFVRTYFKNAVSFNKYLSTYVRAFLLTILVFHILTFSHMFCICRIDVSFFFWVALEKFVYFTLIPIIYIRKIRLANLEIHQIDVKLVNINKTRQTFFMVKNS